MTGYLKSITLQCGFDDTDISVILTAYEKILSEDETSALLSKALSLYEADVDFPYLTEVVEKIIPQLSLLTGLSVNLINLTVLLCLTKIMRQHYRNRGIDESIFINSAKDLRYKTEECKLVKGEVGVFVPAWYSGFFNMTRFGLGRLQFEVIRLGREYNGRIKLTPDSKVINVHIPRTGTPIDKASCDSAYEQARRFFEKEAGKNAPFHCHSWMLFTEMKDKLSPTGNVYRFMSEYDVFEIDYNDGKDLWRLFDTDEKDVNKLPCNSSLRRAVIEHIRSGGRLGVGRGIKLD